MMKKEEQRNINELVDDAYKRAIDELNSEYGGIWRATAPFTRLRSCKAWVYETESFYLLESYRTVVAVIEKSTNDLYDALRTVYGYTATSAQHISKFRTDYGDRYADTYTSRYISD